MRVFANDKYPSNESLIFVTSLSNLSFMSFSSFINFSCFNSNDLLASFSTFSYDIFISLISFSI